MDEVN
jgi:hypothetical protein